MKIYCAFNRNQFDAFPYPEGFRISDVVADRLNKLAYDHLYMHDAISFVGTPYIIAELLPKPTVKQAELFPATAKPAKQPKKKFVVIVNDRDRLGLGNWQLGPWRIAQNDLPDQDLKDYLLDWHLAELQYKAAVEMGRPVTGLVWWANL